MSFLDRFSSSVGFTGGAISDVAFRWGADSIRTAEALAHREQSTYNPVAMSDLTRRGLVYHGAALLALGAGLGGRWLERAVTPDNGETRNRCQREFDLGELAVLASYLFTSASEAVDYRAMVSAQLRQRLVEGKGGLSPHFVDLTTHLADYAERDLRLSEQTPSIWTEVLPSGKKIVIEDHPTYCLIRPETGRNSLFVSIPHHGTHFPPEAIGLRARRWDVAHSDSDLWLQELWGQVPEFGGTLMVAKMGRFAADLNRTRTNATGKTVVGRTLDPKSPDIDEPLWPYNTTGDRLRWGPMSEAAFEARMKRWHAPYTRRRDEEVQRVREECGLTFVISAHNCPTVPSTRHADYGIEEFRIMRPLFIPGTTRRKISLTDRHAGKVPEDARTLPHFALRMVEEFFRAEAIRAFPDFFEGLEPGTPAHTRRACSVDSPYGGAGECHTVMDPSLEAGIPGLQLEISRALIFRESSESRRGDLQKGPYFETLQGVIGNFLQNQWPLIEVALMRHYLPNHS